MGFWRSITGLVTLDLTSADTAAAMTAINQAGIETYRLRQLDELTVSFQVSRRNYRRVRSLTDRRGEKLTLTHRQGLYWTAKAVSNRHLLMAGLFLLLAMVLFLPTRVLFVRVEGNISVPARLIIEKAESCGIGFGASRRDVRSERMKNALLSAIPELQWAGVNTAGCTAIISVRERSDTQQGDKNCGVSRIVASRDGIIQSMTVTNGNALCAVGQAVQAGQTLVSGYTDCGLSILATRSEAEIFAQTKRDLTAVTPADWAKRRDDSAVTVRYSLIIGKNRINFYKDSGISGATCAKMYSEYYLTLPGGFQLPVKLVRETWSGGGTEAAPVEQTAAASTLEQFAADYLASQMVAGQILSRRESLYQTEDIYCQKGTYDCLEMIGRERSEEIIDGESD